jgi:hypothetical protein
MDLLVYGFTTRTPEHFDQAALNTALAALTDEMLDGTFGHLDPSGGVESVEELREYLTSGAEVYGSILSGDHRMASDFLIPGTDLFFTVTGGGSWGDDPYDDWYALGIFLNACDQFHQIAEAAAFVCAGLPTTDEQMLHLKEKKA